jgi:hypothetical protein
MTRKHSKQSAATTNPQEGLENPTAQVSITTKAPDPDQIVALLTKDPARLPGFVQQSLKHNSRLREAAPLIQKTRQNAENRKRAIERVNESKRQSAQRGKSIAIGIANGLMQQEPELRQLRKISKLAKRIRVQWPQCDIPKPSERTIRRWLPEK